MQTKECSDCRLPKLLTEFYARARSKDGRMSRCKLCWNAKYAPRVGVKDGKPSADGRRRLRPHARAFIWLAMHEFAIKEIAETLGRSVNTVVTVRRDLYRQMVRTVARGADCAFARFEPREEAFVRLAYPEFSASAVASVLGRTKSSVRSYASRVLGLNKRSTLCTPRITRRYFRSLQAGATARGFAFQLTLEDIDHLLVSQRGRCALSGLPITYAGKGGTASLDRCDSSLGYVAGNVQWLHKEINLMKLDHSEDHFLKLCAAVVRHHAKLRKRAEVAV